MTIRIIAQEMDVVNCTDIEYFRTYNEDLGGEESYIVRLTSIEVDGEEIPLERIITKNNKENNTEEEHWWVNDEDVKFFRICFTGIDYEIDIEDDFDISKLTCKKYTLKYPNDEEDVYDLEYDGEPLEIYSDGPTDNYFIRKFNGEWYDVDEEEMQMTDEEFEEFLND